MDSQHAVRRNESFEKEKKASGMRKKEKTFPSLLELLKVSVVDDERMKAMSGREFL